MVEKVFNAIEICARVVVGLCIIALAVFCQFAMVSAAADGFDVVETRIIWLPILGMVMGIFILTTTMSSRR